MNLRTLEKHKMKCSVQYGWNQWMLAFMFTSLAVNTAFGKEGGIYLDEPEPVPPPTVVQRQKAVENQYPDGTLRIQRDLLKLSNDRIVNDGTFIEFYRDGQKFTEGTYKMGIHSGTWKFWHANGQLCKSTTFKNGLPDGQWDVFRIDGSRRTSKSYSGGKRDGKWIRYFEDGENILAEELYEMGKLHGTRISYYANGKKRQESNFKAGLLHGMMTEWNEAGEKLAEVPFKEGKVDGKVTRWKADGSTSEDIFRGGKIVPSSASGKE